MDTNRKFQEILLPSSRDEKLDFEAQMIQQDFIARLTEIMKFKGIKSKKELAGLLETSPSYITQLFSGEKLINLKFLAKLQNILGLHYSIVSDQYGRLRKSFYGNLLNKGYREVKLSSKNIQSTYKKGA